MAHKESYVIRMVRRVSIALIVVSIAFALLFPKEWMPRLPGMSRDPFNILWFSIPMAAILLAYEIGRAISTSIDRRRMAKASDQEFLQRFSRPSRQDHPDE